MAPKPGRSGARVDSWPAPGPEPGPRRGGEVGVGPAPAVERQHGRGPLTPGLAEERPTGERLQHLGEATPEVPGLGPSPAAVTPPRYGRLGAQPPPRVADSPSCCGVSPTAQQQAVMARTPPLCVLAAAGSGKTTVLTRRVARRILDGSARADHTLVVTFTRKASRELRDRLGRLGVPGGVSAGTFHAARLRPTPPPLGGPGRAPSRRHRRSRPSGAGGARRPGSDQARRRSPPCSARSTGPR